MCLGIRGLVGFGKRLAPYPIQSPTSKADPPRLPLKAFRGEPAISWFAWHFTPTHSSSSSFATLKGSRLHPDIIGASRWPWVAHQVSGLIRATFPEGIALLRLAFAMAPHIPMLNRATQINSPAHSSIGTPSSFRGRTSTASRHAVSVLFHSPLGVLFTFPSRY